jgi:hypothetical protein
VDDKLLKLRQSFRITLYSEVVLVVNHYCNVTYFIHLLALRSYSLCVNMQYSFVHIDPFWKEVVTGSYRGVLGKRLCINLLWGKWGYVNADAYRHPETLFA